MIKEIALCVGDFVEYSQNVHFMFVECSVAFGYIISKES